MQKEATQNTTSENSEEWNEFNDFNNFVIAKMLDEYKMFAVDLHNTQINIIKNYLWLSAMIATADGPFLAWAKLSFATMDAFESIAGPILMFGIFLAIYSFIVGTRLLLGEKDGSRPNPAGSYLAYLAMAFGDDSTWKPYQARSAWIEHLDKSLVELRQLHSLKGVKIRDLNRFVVASTGTSAIGVIFLYLHQLYG